VIRLETVDAPGHRLPRLARARSRLLGAVRARLDLRSQDGFTLIEMLMVTAMLPIVLGATFSGLEFAEKQTPKNVEYAQAISSTSAGLQRMIRDIRQAYRIDSTTPNSVDFNAVIGSVDLEILYECDLAYPSTTGNTHYKEYRRCRRVSTTTGSSLPSISNGAVVIDRLLNGTTEQPVFTFKDSKGESDPTNPTYIEAKIKVPARGELNTGLNHTITFNNGTSLPNVTLSK
jgi:prepilin-type N-terminal cleavage/methylation domain-containing protein